MPIYDLTAEKAVKLLKEKKLKLALAESCTGGLVSKLITDVSGSSEIFDGGVVSYSNSVKAGVLGVEADMLKRYGAVSCPVAIQMARGVMTLVKSDIGIGITGIAGPNSDDTNKPVGLVYVALCDENSVIVTKLRSDYSGEDVRSRNREASAREALRLIEKYARAYPEKLTEANDPLEILEQYRTNRRNENGNI